MLLPLTAAGLISQEAALLVAGCAISNCCFVAAAVALYLLGCHVLGATDAESVRRRGSQSGDAGAVDSPVPADGEAVARVAALLFCVNPAAVFMSAVYTESLFAFLSFTGMLLLAGCGVRGQDGADQSPSRVRGTLGALCLAGAGFTRSNGTLLVGYVLFYAVVQWKGTVASSRSAPTPLLGSRGASARPAPVARPATSAAPLFALYWLWVALNCAIVVLPYVAVQHYGYWLYCAPAPAVVRAALPMLQLPAQPSHPSRAWCGAEGASPPLVPGMYGFIQAEYWNVGLLRYYEAKQIPNFALAAPILTITFAGVAAYAVRSRLGVAHMLRFARALRAVLTFSQSQPQSAVLTGGAAAAVVRQVGSSGNDVYVASFGALPYVVHWALMGLVAVLVMHVQVATRFLAASAPPLYWYLASWLLRRRAGRKEAAGARRRRETDGDQMARPGWPEYALALYFGGYAVIGTALFCNFYPWT